MLGHSSIWFYSYKYLGESINPSAPNAQVFYPANMILLEYALDHTHTIVKTGKQGGKVVIWDIDGPGFHTIDEFSAEELRKHMDLCFTGYFLAAKHTLPHLRKTIGSIVNGGKTAGTHGQRFATAYCGFQAAVSGFTRALALEEALKGVRVNAVISGTINSPLLHTFATKTEQLKEYEDFAVRTGMRMKH
ncbi:17-beta-hydroxysteroid dehydrogenase 14-like [Mya arenaria]|uniref:17-beta-hydroxysteroid dehydrogenase 14-like n=1 Tax=Mya arenaria TaxID=6604 RepID=UPI0022E37A31|nr:17-beta-hydroxysteroid dehydrogenase 14-like [Mya arenaria]